MNKRQRKKRQYAMRGRMYLAFWVVAQQHRTNCDGIGMIRRADDKWWLHPLFYATNRNQLVAIARIHVGHHRINGRIRWLGKDD